jgi:hypothetical protein
MGFVGHSLQYLALIEQLSLFPQAPSKYPEQCSSLRQEIKR